MRTCRAVLQAVFAHSTTPAAGSARDVADFGASARSVPGAVAVPSAADGGDRQSLAALLQQRTAFSAEQWTFGSHRCPACGGSRFLNGGTPAELCMEPADVLVVAVNRAAAAEDGASVQRLNGGVDMPECLTFEQLVDDPTTPGAQRRVRKAWRLRAVVAQVPVDADVAAHLAQAAENTNQAGDTWGHYVCVGRWPATDELYLFDDARVSPASGWPSAEHATLAVYEAVTSLAAATAREDGQISASPAEHATSAVYEAAMHAAASPPTAAPAREDAWRTVPARRSKPRRCAPLLRLRLQASRWTCLL